MPGTTASPFTAAHNIDDDPTSTAESHAGPSTPTRTPSRPAPSSTASPSASGGGGGGEDSEGEDEMPDYLRLAALTSKASGAAKGKRSTAVAGAGAGAGAGDTVVIPKRGEKDFEPTGFGGQAKLLERSRDAMVSAISGERRSMYKGLTTATWDPHLHRAVVHDLQGKLFETTGQIARRQVRIDGDGSGSGERDDEAKFKMVSRNELLPEEALFLLERGNLVLFARPSSADGAGAVGSGEEWWRTSKTEPMSLQQAFAALIGEEGGLTRERYQIYIYLKRLGYVVQRAADVDRIRSEKPLPTAADKRRKKAAAAAAAGVEEKGILGDPKRPLKLVNDLDLLLYIPRRIWQLLGDAARWFSAMVRRIAVQMNGIANRVVTTLVGPQKGSTTARSSSTSLLGLGTGGGRQRGLLGKQSWTSYNGVYESLQIVPSGHDRPFPTSASASTSSTTDSIEGATENSGKKAKVDLTPFYYAWRPATSYRKTHPPAPEFRIVIIDADVQPVPSAWEFERMFNAIPLPGSLEELGLETAAGGSGVSVAASSTVGGDVGEGGEEDERAQRIAYEMDLKRRNEEANKRAYGKSSEGRLKFLEEKKRQRNEVKFQRRLARSSALERMVGLERAEWVQRHILRPFAAGLWFFRACPGFFPFPSSSSSYNGGNFNHSGGRAGGKSSGGGGGTKEKEFTPPSNPFPPLKAGRKTVVLAVVKEGITMLLRFGEAEFERFRLAGLDSRVGGDGVMGKGEGKEGKEEVAR